MASHAITCHVKKLLTSSQYNGALYCEAVLELALTKGDSVVECICTGIHDLDVDLHR